MFDIGWSEVLVIAAVAILVVGPKELPKMLRTFGKTMGQVRRTANDFKRQFDEAIREAEREVDLDDTRKKLKAMTVDPITDAKKDFDATMRAADPSAPSTPKPVATPSAAPAKAAAGAREAEPLKTGAVTAERGSDAA